MNKSIVIVAILSLAMLTCVVMAQPQRVQILSAAQPANDPVDWWTMFHHDSAHSGYSNSTAPTTNQTLWIYTTNGQVDSSPAVVDGVVYVGSSDDNLYALDAMTGQLIWNYTTGAGINSSPAVVDGVVYVGSIDGNVYALNATTGKKIWSYSIGPGNPIGSSPVVVDTVDGTMLYVGDHNGNVYALNATNSGSLVWIYTTTSGSPVPSSPAFYDNWVYVGSDNGIVYSLVWDTGNYWNSYFTGAAVPSSPAVGLVPGIGQLAFVGSEDSNVYALNLALQTATNPVWGYTTGAGIGFSSPAYGYGMVFCGSDDKNIYAFDNATGAKKWNYTTGGMIESSPSIADNMVFVGSYDHNVYALNAMNGNSVWQYQTNGTVYSSPAIANGIVYVGSDDHNVYAFGNAGALNPLCTMKTTTAGYFYVPTATAPVPTSLKIEMNFSQPLLVGDQTGNSTIPYSITQQNTAFRNWPDQKVNIQDIAVIAKAFGSTPGSPGWNYMADVNAQGKINIVSVSLAAKNFGYQGTIAYDWWLPTFSTDITVVFQPGNINVYPNIGGYVSIPLGSTNFTVYQGIPPGPLTPMGALITFW